MPVRRLPGKNRPGRSSGGFMYGTNKSLNEITRIIKGDVEASNLMDEVLVACFDLVIGDCGAGEECAKRSSDQLLDALDRFNAYLRKYREIPEDGFFSGTPEELAGWAESLTEQIWMNRPH